MSKYGNTDNVVPKAGKKSITVSEAGHLGGLETLLRHGRQHFVTAGRRGQEAITQYYTTKDRRRWGAMGGRPRRTKFTSMGEKEQSK
jgi:hypothetical protein